jgi:hypothetical protein
MDHSYNSSFESEDEAQTETANFQSDKNAAACRSTSKPVDSEKPPPLINQLDLTTLNQELGAVSISNHHETSSGTPKNISEVEVKTQKGDKCIPNTPKNGNTTAKIRGKKELAQPTIICFKRNCPIYQGSAFINRRKKLRQIEHDNMVSAKSYLYIMFYVIQKHYIN